MAKDDGMHIRKIARPFYLFICIQFLACCTDNRETENPYQFEETKSLVDFVEEAAEQVRSRGDAAFKDFSKHGSRWRKGDLYIFVYDLKGYCRFHPVSPELVGRNLIDLKDLNGKPVIEYIVEIASNKQKPYGWVHYLWLEPGGIYPEWKSSYVVRVETPEGKIYAMGSGRYKLKTEKIFVSAMVDSASKLLETKGLDVIPVFSDKAGKYYFKDTFVFILDENGNTIVDPSFPSMRGRNLMKLTDIKGNPFVQDMIEKLKVHNPTWLSYVLKRPNEKKPTKKLVYVRKVIINGKTYILGSSLLFEKPIWLKI
jgi:signal transduction histidine kinase